MHRQKHHHIKADLRRFTRERGLPPQVPQPVACCQRDGVEVRDATLHKGAKLSGIECVDIWMTSRLLGLKLRPEISIWKR